MKRWISAMTVAVVMSCGGGETVPADAACSRYLDALCSLWDRCGVLETPVPAYWPGETMAECLEHESLCERPFGVQQLSAITECDADGLDACIKDISFTWCSAGEVPGLGRYAGCFDVDCY